MHWKKKLKNLLPTIYGAILILIIIMIIYKDLNMIFSIDNVRDFISSFGVMSAIVFILIIIFFSLIEIIPHVLLIMLGGVLFGSIKGATYSVVGITLGSILLFLAVRKYGHQKFVKEEKRVQEFRHLNNLIKKDAVYAIYVAKFIPIFPNELLVIAAAFSKIRLKDFILIIIIGTLPMAFISASLGDAFSTNQLNLGIVIFAILISLSLSIFLFKNKLKKAFHITK